MEKVPDSETFLKQELARCKKLGIAFNYTKYARKFARLHVRAAVRTMTELQYDRASPKVVDELTEEHLREFYPLENIK